jgi:nitronate monooxygenase
MTLLPEVDDALGASATREKRPLLIAAGGITDGRGVAAATILGAHGVCMGTRFLASSEAVIARGYQDAVVAARDGGIATARTSLYDQLRGTTDWPGGYNARGVLNRSWADAEGGMGIAENTRRYQAAAAAEEDEGWGAAGRLATYAGTGVGLVTRVQPAGEIVEEVRREAGERGV